MDLKGLGKGLKDSLQNTVDSVKNMANEVELPDLKEVGEKTSESLKNLLKKDEKDQAEQEEVTADLSYVSTRTAIKIIYFQMIADTEVNETEQETLDLICSQLDEEYQSFKEQLFAECKASMDKLIDPEDYYDVLVEGAEEALRAPQNNGSIISSKLLVWDMMSIVYSDKNCTEIEKRFLKHIVRRLNIDKAIFLEMESSMRTIMDIDKETEWVKTTNKPYLTIEAIIKELENRRNIIMQSVIDLIEL